MRLQDERIVFFDLETGGLDPQKHPVIQWASIATDGELRELESLELKIRFDILRADPEALAKNRYDPAVWEKHAISEEEALGCITNFVGRNATMPKLSAKGRPYTVARMCAHNARFDGEFTAAWFKRWGAFFPGACFEALDSLALGRWASLFAPTGPKNHKLESLCEWLGVKLDNAHDALADVRATVEVVRILTGRLGIGKAVAP